ncbi:MAG: hypothetical protein ACOYOK_05215 [Pseudobdellovibrionaceae bacterium]
MSGFKNPFNVLFFLVILGLFALSACNGAKGRSSVQPDENTQVQLLWPSLWVDDGNLYSFSNQNLSGLTSLDSFSGRFANFFMNPSLNRAHKKSSQETDKIKGVAPRTRFSLSGDGVWIPGDTLSMQLAVLYAHMQNFALLDVKVGAAEVNPWPRDIAVSVQLDQASENNAFYDADLDAMLFVSYTQEGMPLSINAGVLAHEHFHSLFSKIVLKKLNKDQAKISDYKKVLLRGLNEGLADYWGWMYTGDLDFISRSLSEEKSARSLRTSSSSPIGILSSASKINQAVELVKDEKNKEKYLLHYAYSLGNQYAKLTRLLTEQVSVSQKINLQQAALIVARAIVASLPDFKTQWLALSKDQDLSPQNFFLLLANHIEKNSSHCEFFMKVLNSAAGGSEGDRYKCDPQFQLQKIVIQENIAMNK